MEQIDTSITYSDIKNYWLKLFPELDSMSELDEIFKNVSNIEKNEINDFIDNYTDHKSIPVDELLKKDYSPLLQDLSLEIYENNKFFNFFKPFFNYYINDLIAIIDNLNIIDNTHKFIKYFLINESTKLLEYAQRTLVLEVNIARTSGLLKGNSSEDRFNYFTATLLNNKEYLKSIYNEYSHLYNLLVTRCMWDFNFIIDVVNHTEDNIHNIKNELLTSSEDIKISTIDTSLGDSHNKGKTVSIIHFTNNSKVVYKPRSLDLEFGFNKFIDYLNNKSNDSSSDLLQVKIINKSNFGFCEFIEYKECNSQEEVINFYYKTGKLLAALFALNARDIHYENIIASGSNPIVIDLEALFHSDITLWDKKFFKSIEVAQKIIDSSVYSIGFLPQKISNPYDDSDDTYVDVSGFSSEEKQKAPFKALSVVNNNTDEIKIEKVEGFITSQNNTPKLKGKVAPSEDYVSEIKAGFSDIYDILLSNKEEVIDLIKSIFSSMKNRFILRPTYIYGQLINTSYHPDFMREEIHRYVLLHRLAINAEAKFNKVFSSEIHDILLGDVPYFYCNIASNNIKNSKDEDINMILDSSPLDKDLDKINNLSEDDKNMQLNFIDMSFLAKTTNSHKDETNIKFSSNVSLHHIDTSKYMDLSIKIGDYLIAKSILGSSDTGIDRTWISTVLLGRDECTWSLAAVGNSLYEGNSGIALFLAYLGKVTGESRFTTAALEAVENLIGEIEILDSRYPFLVGSYNGITGYFYTLYNLYKITKNQRFLNIIKDKINILYEFIPKDKSIDVIGGSAGALGVLLNIYNDCDDALLKETLLDLSNLCFTHIKESKIKVFDDSAAWGSGGAYVPYTGFAHGNAGIIAYLMKLYHITKNPEILSLIKEALNYERHLYSEIDKNWYSSHTKDMLSLGWCHGAPGILLSNLILKEYGYNDEYLDKEIKIALDTTLKQGIGNNPCLCHGDLGNISIIKYAAKLLNDKELNNRCLNTFEDVYNNVLKVRWDKGVFSGTESMGLMIGLSSFGYSLLKEIAPYSVPEILWF